MIFNKDIINSTPGKKDTKFFEMEKTPVQIVIENQLSKIDGDLTAVPKDKLLPEIPVDWVNTAKTEIENVKFEPVKPCGSKNLLPPPVITSKLWKRRMERWNCLKK